MTVLLVEDDADIRRLVAEHLERHGMAVTVASTAGLARETLCRGDFLVVILDLTLPDGSGLDLLVELRKAGSAAHVIILSGAVTEFDRVRALELGADDYIGKPFSARELTARVLAVRRRRDPKKDSTLRVGHLVIDVTAREVMASGRPVELSTKEFDLLAFLAARPGHVFSRDDLLRAVWQSASEWQQAATVTEHMSRLRAKVELEPAHPKLLRTVRGAGYRLDVPADDLDAEASGVTERKGQPARAVTTTAAPDPSLGLRRLLTGVATEVSDAVIVTDLHSHIRSWNRGAARLYGWAEHEVLGRHILDIVNWRDGLDPAVARETLESTGRWNGEGVQITRDGGEIRVHGSATMAYDDSGEPIGVVSIDRGVLPIIGSHEAPTTQDEAEMRRAIANGEFEVYYQPLVDLEIDRIVGFEGLLRWNHPRRGLLSPAAFLETAERSGLIVELGASALGSACRQGAAWRRAGHALDVGVNLSTREVADPGLFDRVLATLQSSGMDPRNLWFDVTETSLVKDVDQASVLLHRLAELGIRISIDDFGTGWASLTYLKEFPAHALKIDRSFVENIDRNLNDTAIARSILSLGAELGLTVVAEGVETRAQERALQALGCSMAQGFLYGKPTPAAAVPLHRFTSPGPRSGGLADAANHAESDRNGDAERKGLEAQQWRAQRTDGIGFLAGGFAHDLNNALGPILMATELLRDEETDESRLSLLDTIASGTQRATELVRQTLSSGAGIEGRRAPVDIGAMLRDVERIANDTLLKTIRIVREEAADVASVTGDATQLIQALLNLCVNASDAMPHGGTLVLAADSVVTEADGALEDATPPGRYVRIRVEDDGEARPHDVLDRTCEFSHATNEHGHRTGLGLSTAGIISSHGGFTHVDRAPGKGTRFLIYLPAPAGDAALSRRAL